MSGYFDWTDAAKERVRELWLAGDKTKVIAQKVGVSKNAIVGMANRMKLPARPSPIRAANPGAVAKPKRVAPPPLPALQSVALPMVPAPAVRPAPPKPAVVFRPRACAWVLDFGERSRTNPRYCEAPTRMRPDGKPCVYCVEHAEKAFVRRAS